MGLFINGKRRFEILIKEGGVEVADSVVSLDFDANDFILSQDADGNLSLSLELIPAYPEAYLYAESDGESANATATWQQKLRLSLTNYSAGDYRFSVAFSWRQDSTNKWFEGRVELDDTTQIFYHRAQPNSNNATQRNIASSFDNVTLTQGNHTFDLDFRQDGSGGIAYIREARMDIWRIS